MERTPIIGFITVSLSIIIGILLTSGGRFQDYFNIPSFFITIVGSFGAVIVMNRTANVLSMFSLFKKVFDPISIEINRLLPKLLSLSEKARREGLLSLEDDLDELEDNFLRFSLQLVIDGTDPEIVKKILGEKIESIENRHADKRQIFENLAEVSPAFGMVGTVIGLIYMLSSLGGDLTVLGVGMATALITTLYGVLLANGLWTPIANRLYSKTKQEILQKTIIMEGILSIQFGDNPRILKQKLLAFFGDDANLLDSGNVENFVRK